MVNLWFPNFTARSYQLIYLALFSVLISVYSQEVNAKTCTVTGLSFDEAITNLEKKCNVKYDAGLGHDCDPTFTEWICSAELVEKEETTGAVKKEQNASSSAAPQNTVKSRSETDKKRHSASPYGARSIGDDPTPSKGASSSQTVPKSASSSQKSSAQKQNTTTKNNNNTGNGLGNTVSNAIRINAGGKDYTDTNGNLYQADTYHKGGNLHSTPYGIANTHDDTLYQTERWARKLHYAIPVAKSGNYQVRLHMAEIYFAEDGRRIFDVSIEGKQMIDDIDVHHEAKGKHKAFVKAYDVDVTDGTLDIEMAASRNHAKIAAIEVLYQSAAVGANSSVAGEPIAIGGRSFTVPKANGNYVGDAVLLKSNGIASTTIDIKSEGTYLITINARADLYQGPPLVDFVIGNKTVAKSLAITTKASRNYEVKVDLSAGKHKAYFAFLNDAYAGRGKDRNVIINYITAVKIGGNTGSTTPTKSGDTIDKTPAKKPVNTASANSGKVPSSADKASTSGSDKNSIPNSGSSKPKSSSGSSPVSGSGKSVAGSSQPLPSSGSRVPGCSSSFSFAGHSNALSFDLSGPNANISKGEHAKKYWGPSSEYVGRGRTTSLSSILQNASDVVDITPNMSVSQINGAIAGAQNNTWIRFKNGTYNIDRPIEIKRSDVIVAGESAGGVRLHSTKGAGQITNIFRIEGGSKEYIGNVSKGFASLSRNLSISGANKLKSGDLVLIDAKSNKNTQFSGAAYSQLMTVNSVSGSNVNFKHRVALISKYVSNGPTAYKINGAIKDVTVANFIIDFPKLGDVSSDSELRNSHTNREKCHNAGGVYEDKKRMPVFEVKNYTHRLNVHNIESRNACSHHFRIERALESYVENYTANGSWSTGDYGRGYGYDATATSYGVVNGFTGKYIRHSYVGSLMGGNHFGIVCGLTGNDNSDFHGSTGHYNFIEMIDIEKRDMSNYDMKIFDWRNHCVDFVHNTVVANGKHIEQDVGRTLMRGSTRPMTLRVSKPGANWDYNNNGSYDLIIGGLGNDQVTFSEVPKQSEFMVGENSGVDTLDGMNLGKFKILIRKGTYGLNSYNDLSSRIRQSGSNVEIAFDGRNKIIIKNAQKGQVGSNQFKFMNSGDFNGYCPMKQNH